MRRACCCSSSIRPHDDGGGFGGIPTLRQLARIEPLCWPADAGAESVRERARERIAAIEQLAQQAGDLALMDYRFLYDAARDLLAIGYNVDERRLDASYYDLLASEARLASFVAIAQGQLPQDNWFALGRLLTTSGGEPVLLSWSGSMFEYLMPLLVMPSYEGTLLDQTCRAAVAAADRVRQPARRAVGHFRIRLQHGRRALQLPVPRVRRARPRPQARARRRPGDRAVRHRAGADGGARGGRAGTCSGWREAGAAGRFGLYEAIDYTPARLPRGQIVARWCGRSWRITRA